MFNINNILSNYDNRFCGVPWAGGGGYNFNQAHRVTGSGFDLTGLKAYYKFDEASGNILNKASSVGSSDAIANSELVVEGATFGATGIIDDALSFDGVNDDATADNVSAGDWNFLHNLADDMTMNFWYKMTDRTQVTKYMMGDGAFGSDQLGIDLWISSRTLNVSIKNGTTFVIQFAGSNFFPDDSNFHMITIRFDPNIITDSCLITLDGNTGGQSTSDRLAVANNGNHDQLFSFVRASASWMAYDVDESSFWSRLLTDTEISDLYNSGSGLAL